MKKLRHLGMVVAILAVVVLLGFGGRVDAASRFPAYISATEVALGGVQLGATQDYVRGIYGEPTSIKDRGQGAFGHSVEWTYGTTFHIVFGNGRAYSITTEGNNGVKTPAGFTVGGNIRDVIAYFGEDKVSKNQNYGRFTYRFSSAFYAGISFVTDRRGDIASIYCWESP